MSQIQNHGALNLKNTLQFITKSVQKSMTIFIKTDILKEQLSFNHQPDWSDLYLKIKNKKQLSLKSLIVFLLRFRDENHFHEECAETIFADYMSF